MNEKQLILALKESSQQALDAIYRLYAPRLFSFCLRYTKHREDAEEIVQDVFVKLWLIRHSIRQEERLTSLLFIMAHRQLINAYRTRVNSELYTDYIALLEHVEEKQVCELEYHEFVMQVKRQIAKLPPTQRHIVELSRWEGYSHAEIAEKLQLSEQTIRNQLSMALKTLRINLHKHVVG